MILKKPFILVAALLAAQSVHAHGTWIAQRVDQPTIVYGHGGEDNAYGDKTISNLIGLDKDGKAIEIAMEKHPLNVTLSPEAQHYGVAYVLDNGFWTKDKKGKWFNQPKHEVANADSAVHSIKTAIGILQGGGKVDAGALSNLPLAMIPLSDVAESHMGDKVPVQVLLDGKPLADAEIIGDYVNDDETIVATTDSEGKAEVPVRNKGWNVFAVEHKIALENDQNADALSYNATLSFNNDHHHD